MSQTQGSPQDNVTSRRVSWPVIAAVAFLVISLVVSGIWIAGVLSGPTTPPPEQAEDKPSDASSGQLEAEDTPEAAANQPTVQPNSLIIALTPLGGNAPALGDQLAQALQKASQGAALPDGVTIQTVALAPSWASIAEIDLTRDAPDADMLIAWEQAEVGLVRFYLSGMTAAPLPMVDSTPTPWDIPAPGNVSLYTGETDGIVLPTGLAIGLLEISAGAGEQALGRFQALQALPTIIPIDKMASNQAVFSFAIARTQTARGDPTGALQSYSQALKLQDNFTAAAINRGNVYLALGDPTAALSAFDAAKSGGPDAAVALYDRVLAYQMTGDSDTALAAASQAVEQAPGAAWSTNLRGTISYQQGDFASASTDFAAARQAAPGLPEPVFNHALALYALEDFTQALAAFDVLLQIDPDNPVYTLHQGETHQANGDVDQAKEAFSRAIELDPAYLEAYLRRARLYYVTGDAADAQADAEQAISLNPDDGRAYQIIGDMLLDGEDFGKAEDAYTEAIERGVSSIELFAARGWARHMTRYNGGAIEDYERALELGAKDNTLLFRLGFALFDAGRYQDSLEALSGAVNGGLDTAEAHAALALALDANLQRDEAEQEYQHALNLDPRFDDRTFLKEQPLWSQGAISRAMSIVRRMEN